jgi:hypothetical protein
MILFKKLHICEKTSSADCSNHGLISPSLDDRYFQPFDSHLILIVFHIDMLKDGTKASPRNGEVMLPAHGAELHGREVSWRSSIETKLLTGN